MKSEKIAFVLVVDDNPENLQVMGSVLTRHGYRTAVAENGKQVREFDNRKNWT